MLGADFNDRLLSLANTGELTGSAQPRLRLRPTAMGQAIPAMIDTFREQLSTATSARLWASVGAGSSGAELGELLRALRVVKCEVQGFVDGATVVVAWVRLPGQSVVIDLYQYWTDLSLVVSTGDIVELRRTARIPVGRVDLFDHWLRLAAQTLVQQTRFDPLHDQRHELVLRDGLLELAVQAQRDGQSKLDFDVDARRLELTLSRDQMQQAAAPWYEALSAALQPLCAAAGECNLVVPEFLLQLPGIDEALTAAHPGSLYALTEGARARAASLMHENGAPSSGAVPFLTRVSAAMPLPGEDVCRSVQQGERQVGTMATHLIYRGRAIPIPGEGMVLGRADDAGLKLPEGIAGLSRRHCTLQRTGGRTLIIDHSRHGSFIDGLRVRGRGFLAAGSVLRVGTPGIEFPLIAL